MENYSKEFSNIFKRMYDSGKIYLESNSSFKEVIKSNSSRLDFLNQLLEKVNSDEVDDDFKIIIEENIDFIYSFLKGEFNHELPVPDKYFNDMDKCAIIPSEEELEYLFSLIQMNIDIYNSLYRDNNLVITLPPNSFNMNMVRILEVKNKNLAHLMGLTESEKKKKSNINLLKKYFLASINNREQNGDAIAEPLLNWIVSEEGKETIRKLNKIVTDFAEHDKQSHPNSYDQKGNIKDVEKFKERFKETTNFDYPIIKFSRYITKCINNINYLNLANITQMILDYNSALDSKKNPLDNDEKDIFIVNTPISKLLKHVKYYLKRTNDTNRIIEYYALHQDEKDIPIEDYLKKEGIDIDDKYIKSYINLVQSYSFVGKHGINPDQTIATTKISETMNKYFLRDIHLIGFGTDFEKNDTSRGYSHCDTSKSIKVPELVNTYYKRGRAFFIDKIYNTTGGVSRISTPIEELQSMTLDALLGIEKSEDIERLKDKIVLFEQEYLEYKNKLDKGNHRGK